MEGSAMRGRKWIRAVAAGAALTLLAVACGDDGGSTASGDSSSGLLTKVKLQLQWVTQAQFAGYFAAVEQGYYKEQGLDVSILEAAVDTVPAKVLADGGADFAVSWVPKALQTREAGADVVQIAQVFQKSGTRQVSFKDKNITTPTAFKGKKVGNWGFGNEYEVFAAITKAGLDPAKDVTNVQQQFDMVAMLAGEIDAAEAMTYNEYAQVLEAKNPKTGKLYTPQDFNVVDYNTEGVAMLQDALWANGKKLANDKTYQETTTKFLTASLEGWIYCRDNAQACADLVVAKGSKLGKSHQLWQMNEVNKLIWPSTTGIGAIDKTAYDQTVKIAQGTKNLEGKTVLSKTPDAAALNTTYVTKAIAALEAKKLDTKGVAFKPITVTLAEGGQ